MAQTCQSTIGQKRALECLYYVVELQTINSEKRVEKGGNDIAPLFGLIKTFFWDSMTVVLGFLGNR